MVKLIPMEQKDFEIFLERGIREYAEDHARNGNWSAEEAWERSTKEFEQLLPDGIHSKDQFLFSIIDLTNGNKIGSLWAQVRGQKAFIYDFIVDEAFRGKGYGKLSLATLDEKLISRNVESVGLHVFGHNIVAQELYKKSGYEITNINMRKVFRKTGSASQA